MYLNAPGLKSFKLKYLGLESFNKAIVTKGGIDVKELNPQTMEIKKISGLYFVGEVKEYFNNDKML